MTIQEQNIKQREAWKGYCTAFPDACGRPGERNRFNHIFLRALNLGWEAGFKDGREFRPKSDNSLGIPTDSVEYLRNPDEKGVNRDKFADIRLTIAAQAMQGILANQEVLSTVLQTGQEMLEGEGITYRAVAVASILFADALIDGCRKGGSDGED